MVTHEVSRFLYFIAFADLYLDSSSTHWTMFRVEQNLYMTWTQAQDAPPLISDGHAITGCALIAGRGNSGLVIEWRVFFQRCRFDSKLALRLNFGHVLALHLGEDDDL